MTQREQMLTELLRYASDVLACRRTQGILLSAEGRRAVLIMLAGLQGLRFLKVLNQARNF